MSDKGLGMTAVLDAQGVLSGVFTDGDLRRCIDAEHDLHHARVGDVMTRGGIRMEPGQLAAEALKLMEEKKINALLVVDETGQLQGALNMHDLLRAGVV
jgi:arabinose-5-phosphate isomerase